MTDLTPGPDLSPVHIGDGTLGRTTAGTHFTPPVDDYVSLANQFERGYVLANRLLAHLEPLPRSPNLWRLSPGVYTTIDPLYGEPYEYLYHGAHITPVSPAEVEDLTSAGYGEGIFYA